MSRTAPPKKEPRPRRRGTKSKKTIRAEIATTEPERKPILANSSETNAQFIARLLRQQEFSKHLIHQELADYRALLTATGKQFVKYRFIERLLAARHRHSADLALAESIAKTRHFSRSTGG